MFETQQRTLSWHATSRRIGAYFAALSSHSVIGEINSLSILSHAAAVCFFWMGGTGGEQPFLARSSKRGPQVTSKFRTTSTVPRGALV